MQLDSVFLLLMMLLPAWQMPMSFKPHIHSLYQSLCSLLARAEVTLMTSLGTSKLNLLCKVEFASYFVHPPVHMCKYLLKKLRCERI